MFSLKEMFGKEVKVTYEDGPRSGDKCWYQEIVGKRGFIYPQSESTVCVQTTPRIGKKLLAVLKGSAVFKRRGDTEFELIIPLSAVRTAFKYIKPKRRKQLTEAQKQALRLRLDGAHPAQDDTSGATHASI